MLCLWQMDVLVKNHTKKVGAKLKIYSQRFYCIPVNLALESVKLNIEETTKALRTSNMAIH